MKKIFATIRRMGEIWKRWRICRIVYENASVWQDQIKRGIYSQEIEKDPACSKYDPATMELLASGKVVEDMIEELGKPLWVKRKAVITTYLRKYCKSVQIQDLYSCSQHKEARHKFKDINDVLEACTTTEATDEYTGYINTNKKGDALYLNRKGRRFASKDQLAKALGNELTNIVGAWKIVLITAGIVRLDLVIDFFKWTLTSLNVLN